MENARANPLYDLFKLIVALILLALLIYLQFNTGARQPATSLPAAEGLPAATQAEPAQGLLVATEISTATTIPTVMPMPTATNAEPAAATIPTATPAPTATRAEPEAATIPTDMPAPTATSAEPAAPQPVATQAEPAASGDCPLAAPARLSVGANARVLRNLHFRSSPGIQDNLIRINPAGVVLEVIGGPMCLPHGGGEYWWWELQAPDGTTGWSAEGGFGGSFYFLQPEP